MPHSLSDARRKVSTARIKDAGGIEGFLVVLATAETSKFIREDMAGWSLDWLLKPANFEKVRDGNYNRERGSTPRAPPAMQI